MPATPRGRFIWHELMTTAPDAAIAFYGNVVGWGSTGWEQDPSYRLLTMKGTPMAGLMRLPDEARAAGAPPHWLSYVSVSRVEAAVAQATALGATVYVQPRDIPTVGRFAVLADPQGAVFAVYTPATPQVSTGDLTLGDFSWHELATTDWRAGWEFYRALFGWEHESSFDMGPAGTYWMFKRAGGRRPLGGMYTKPPEMPAPPHWLPYVLVPSADRAAELAGRHGGRVLNGPMDVPGGDRVAQLMDPQGGAFAVHSLAAAAQRAAPGPDEKSAPRKRARRKAAKKRNPLKRKKKAAKAARARKRPARRRASKAARRHSTRARRRKRRR
jgi:hypothetical protein